MTDLITTAPIVSAEGYDLITQLHEDVDVVRSGRLLFRPVWTKPPFDDEGSWMLETREAGD